MGSDALVATQCPKCNWTAPLRAGSNFTICICGHRIDTSSLVDPVAYAASPPRPRAKICTHRGEHIGQASCGCGAIYKCNLFNVLCGNKQPPDEWADVGGQFLGADFRVCSKCKSFTSKEAI